MGHERKESQRRLQALRPKRLGIMELPSFEMGKTVDGVGLVGEMGWSGRAEQRHLLDIQVGMRRQLGIQVQS